MLMEQGLQDMGCFSCPEPRGSAGHCPYQPVCGRAEQMKF